MLLLRKSARGKRANALKLAAGLDKMVCVSRVFSSGFAQGANLSATARARQVGYQENVTWTPRLIARALRGGLWIDDGRLVQ
jgi:hypothetical protein